MQKVISINLNGNAYQLEEPGYEALRAYLERADSRLRANPDCAEIMADLELAIAEKCGRYLGANKTVITTAEIDTIIAEMGPVETPEASAQAGASAGTENRPGTGTSSSSGAAAPAAGKNERRRLYQIREGAMISGVCNGLAAFLDIDVTVVRLLFVIITFATFGAWILAYLLMAFFIPYADTPEDRAAAFGLGLKAEELLGHNLQRASAHARREWRRTWRRQQRASRRDWGEQWHRNWGRQWQEHVAQQAPPAPPAMPPLNATAHFLTGISLPIVAVVSAAVFVAWILVVISAVLTGTIFGWPLPEGLPLWGSLLILFAIYIAFTSPLRAARHAHLAWGPLSPWASISGVFWVGFTGLFFWLAYQHIPQVHALLDQLPSLWERRQVSYVLNEFSALF
jgi:phage shock protein PspC (stress-responsive transcriptional regulator)